MKRKLLTLEKLKELGQGTLIKDSKGCIALFQGFQTGDLAKIKVFFEKGQPSWEGLMPLGGMELYALTKKEIFEFKLQEVL